MKPDGDCIDSREWFVGDCDEAKARRLIERYHYAGGASNTGVGVHGLYREADWELAGVTWWLPPINVGSATWPVKREVLALSRMVVIPGSPKNAASFLLSRSSKLVDGRWKCLVTYADTWRGHAGTIYRAAGWEYRGMTRPEGVYVIGGVMVSRKAGPTTRTHAQMIGLGAGYLGKFPKHRFRLVRPAVRARAPGRVQGTMFDLH